MISVVWGSTDCPITQPYGPNHRGIDIGMATGTPLYAARAGVVSTIGQGNLCLTVGDNLRDWYLHISSAAVSVGAHVVTGQLIAYSGAVQVPGGPAPTGPHLHFEVQTGQLDIFATSLDPVPVLEGSIIVPDMDTYFRDPASGAIYNVGNLGKRHVGPAEWSELAGVGRTYADAPAALAEIPDVPSVEPPDASGVPVDLAPVLIAIASIGADVVAVKRLLEKDLAP